MKHINGGKQMSDVWHLPAIAQWEKSCGKHPTQKPLALLVRIIMASTQQGEWVFDPFCGSSTTGIAANLLNRRFLGIDQNQEYLNMSIQRREELNDIQNKNKYRTKLKDIQILDSINPLFVCKEAEDFYGDLPF